MKLVKHFFCLFVLLTFIPLCFAGNITYNSKVDGDDYWYTLKLAQNAYESNDYGTALSYAEEAKEKKLKVCKWENEVLDQCQRNFRVRKAGDYLVELIPVLQEKSYTDALEIINKNIKLYGSDFFKGRFSVLRKWIEEDYIYPEADFLIGRVYKLEGEIDLSTEYLNKAYDNRIRLDVADVKYDILYELADLADYRDDGRDFEQKLTAILVDDKLYTDTGFMDALERIINLDTEISVEKFFLLYRSDNDISIRALQELSEYYNRVGQKNKALRCAALGCIASVTKIEDILKDRLIDYSYSTFPDMLRKASAYSDIIAWGNSNNIWKLFFNMAKIARSNEKMVFGDTLMTILSKYEPEPYWQTRATAEILSKK